MRRLPTRPVLHTGAIYVVFFMATGVLMPFWPLWLADWGLTPEEVGLYTALGVAVRVVAGMAVPALADRLDRRRQTLAACAVATLLLFLAHLDIVTKPVLLLATIAVGATMAGIGPLAEALGRRRVARLALSLRAGPRHRLRRLSRRQPAGRRADRRHRLRDRALVDRRLHGRARPALARPSGRRQGHRPAPPRLGEIGRLVLNPVFAVFMGVFAFFQASHAMLYSLGSIHWRDLGIGETEIGALWAASVAAEIVFMLVLGTCGVDRLGPVGAMALSAVAGIVRWSVMTADPVGLLALADPVPACADLRRGAPRRHRLHQPRRPRPLLRRRPGRRRGDGGGRRHGGSDGAGGVALSDARRPDLRPRHRLRRAWPSCSASGSPAAGAASELAV